MCYLVISLLFFLKALAMIVAPTSSMARNCSKGSYIGHFKTFSISTTTGFVCELLNCYSSSSYWLFFELLLEDF